LDTDWDLVPDIADIDMDGDGFENDNDSFPLNGTEWFDTDSDGTGDNADEDIDGDGVSNDLDDLPFNSGETSDHDSDGVGDISDQDDDNDGMDDQTDQCGFGDLGWTSGPGTDHDGDGCNDDGEDMDDDQDGAADSDDSCPRGDLSWTTGPVTDFDSDGCRDSGEDTDDDNDGVADLGDSCLDGQLGWISSNSSDNDSDGCRDSDEDSDDDNDGVADGIDDCQLTVGTSDFDRDGCPDSDGDGWSDPDENWAVQQGADAFVLEVSQWTDVDGDGYGDNPLGFEYDSCAAIVGNSTVDSFGCSDSDGDGVSDSADKFPEDPTKWYDSDDDGVDDQADGCSETPSDEEADSSGCSASQRDTDQDGFNDDRDPCQGSSSNLCMNAATGAGGKERTTMAILVWFVAPLSLVVAGLVLARRKGLISFGGAGARPRETGVGKVIEAEVLEGEFGLGDFEKGTLLSEGGMAMVFRSTQVANGRTCAWKEATPSRFNPLEEVNYRLKNEADALRSLDHPRVPALYAQGPYMNEHGQHVEILVMQYFAVPSLKEELEYLFRRGTTDSLESAKKVLSEVCEALEYMADQEPPIYHRDVKPDNILVDPEKGAVMIDFGLAKEISAGTDVSMSRGASEGWSPPERRDGISGGYTDVFSLGQVLWHMLTGERPFHALSRDEIEGRLVEKGHPEWVAGLIHSSAQRQDRRIQTVAEFKIRLENKGEMG
jgi:hypothetical protein